MITFERRVPEEARAERAAKVIDDIIDAEAAASRQGGKAAAGVAAVGVGAAILTALGDSDA
jgi:hypothetical protein